MKKNEIAVNNYNDNKMSKKLKIIKGQKILKFKKFI